MNTPLLSRAECNIMRGLAIMGIFLHNYCHWLGPVVKENEYTGKYIKRMLENAVEDRKIIHVPKKRGRKKKEILEVAEDKLTLK